MDNEEKLSGSENNSREPARNGARNNRRRVGTRRRISTATLNIIAQIAIAIIGVVGTITAAWLGYQANQPPPTQIPNATLIATSSPAPSDTPIPFTETSSPTVSPSPTSTITITVTAVETLTLTPAPALIVLLENDRAAGRPPLTVNFDARDSYLIASDGQQYPCKYGACNYTWKVVSEGQKLEKTQLNSNGKFQYTFGKRGKYLISVWICRGKDAVNCGGNGIYIEVG